MTQIYDIYNHLFIAFGTQQVIPINPTFERITTAVLLEDERFSHVAEALGHFPSRPSPELIETCCFSDLCEWLHSLSHATKKAEYLKRISSVWNRLSADSGTIKPHVIRNELMDSGVCPVTVDAILLYAFDQPYFVADKMVRRIFTRLGFDLPAEYDETREYFENRLPYRSAFFLELRILLSRLSDQFCRSEEPMCENCPLKDVCETSSVLTNRFA